MLKYLIIALSLFMLSGCGTTKKAAPEIAPDTIATVDSLAFLSDTAK
jgi:uncharacterized lipoprotein YajG